MSDSHQTKTTLIEELVALRAQVAALTQAEAARDQAQQADADWHHLTLENLSDAVLITDDAGKLIFVSPGAQRIFGYTVPEIEAMGQIADLLGDHLFVPNELAMHGELPNIERVIADKFGANHTLLVTVKQIASPHGTRLYTCRDITAYRATKIAYHQHLEELAAQRTANLTEINAQLRASEERYRMLYEQTPAMLHSIDAQGRLISVSDHWLAVMGYERDAVLGRKSVEFLTAATREYAENVTMPEFYRQGWIKDVNLQFVKKNGEVIDVLLSAIVMPGKQGHERHAMAVLIDVTERKRAEVALRASEARWRNLIETLPQGFGIRDENNISTYTNEAFCRMIGYTSDEIVGRSLYDFIAPGSFAEFEQQMQNQKTGAAPLYELIWVAKDGHHVPTLASPRPILDDQGNYRGSFAVITDITDLKQAQAALAASEARWRNLIETVPQGFGIRDENNISTYVNDAFCAMLGYAREEIIGQNLTRFLVPASIDKQQQQMLVQKTGQKARYELTWQAKDGHLVSTLISSHPIIDDAGHYRGSFAVIADITDFKQTQAALAASETRLKRAEHVAQIGHYEIEIASGNAIWSDETFRIFGRSPAEGAPNVEQYAALLHPDDREPLLSMFEHSITTGALFDLVYRIIRPDGEVRYVHSIGTLGEAPANQGKMFGTIQDITEQRAVQAALRENEDRFRLSFEFSHTGMALVSPTGAFIDVNQRTCDILGYTRDELMALDYTTITHPDDHTRFMASFGQALAGEYDSYTMEKRYLHKDGHVIWGVLSIAIIRDTAGAPMYATAQLVDVTEQHAVQAALRESEERFRQIASTISEVFWMTDLAMNTTLYVSPAYEKIWGRPCDTLYQDSGSWLDAIHPADRDGVVDVLQLHRQGTATKKEYRIIQPDGSIRWVQDRAFPVLNDAGEVYRIAGICEDITARKLAEDALRESEARLEAAQEHARLGNWEIDPTTWTGYWSKQMYELYYRDPATGVPTMDEYLELMHPDDREQFLIATNNKTAAFDHRTNPANGPVRHLSLTVNCIEDHAGEVVKVTGTVLDITTRKQAEQQQLALELEKRRAEILAKLVQDIKHEVGTSLTVIYSNLHLIKRQVAGLADNPKLAMLEKHIQYIEQLIDRMLMMARLDTISNLSMEQLDINRLAEITQRHFRVIVEENNLTLTLDLAADLPTIQADPHLIIQALQRIIENAVRYTPGPGTITLKTLTHDDEVLIEVRDTGIGINAADLPHIFERFYRVDQARSTRGAGLGLSIAQRIAEAHHGRIEVESEPGIGSTFRLYLPVTAPTLN